MSPEKRSAVMSKIRGKDTGPERQVAAALTALGEPWESHAKDLPVRPDFVFRAARVAVFVDGDFWHGWRFPSWKDKLSEAWEQKIADNRSRDQRNQRKLRRSGWKVIRIWEHQIQRDLDGAMGRVIAILKARKEEESGN